MLDDVVDLPAYLTGTKTDALAYGPDNLVVYIAAAGKVYMVDMVTRKLVYTLDLGASSMNITALTVAGDWMYIAEGSSWGTSNAARLLRININSKSAEFLREPQQLLLPPLLKVLLPQGRHL